MAISRTATLYCFQQHFGDDLPLRPLMRRFRQHLKITFAEMRESGVRGILVYCADYQCSHSIAISDPWPDDLRRSDIEHRFVCVYSLLSSVPRSILSAIGLDRVRQKNAGADQRNDGHY
jgi:hypothetical protein